MFIVETLRPLRSGFIEIQGEGESLIYVKASRVITISAVHSFACRVFLDSNAEPLELERCSAHVFATFVEAATATPRERSHLDTLTNITEPDEEVRPLPGGEIEF